MFVILSKNNNFIRESQELFSISQFFETFSESFEKVEQLVINLVK